MSNLQWLAADIHSKVHNNWNPPSALAAGSHRGRVEIKVTLTKKGKLIDPKIIRSSGSRPMDQSVLEAIVTLQQTIIPPEDEIPFIIDFNLN